MLGGVLWHPIAIDVKGGEKKNIAMQWQRGRLLIQVVIDGNRLMKVERLDDNMEDIIWSSPNDAALWHITALAEYYHDDIDVLHDDAMTPWLISQKMKTNEGEAKQWRRHSVLCIFCTKKIKDSHQEFFFASLETSFQIDSYTIF